MKITKRRRLLTAGLLCLLSATGCAGGQLSSGSPATSPSASAGRSAAGRATPGRQPGAVDDPGSGGRVSDDLKKGSAERVIKSGQLTVNATYTTSLKTSQWTPGAIKPITVTVTAINNGDATQKIFMSKLRVSATPSDANGPIGDPINFSDTANITPGYLVSFPYTYEQNFTVPAIDDGSVSLAITFNYELLSLISDDGKQYTKQTATSTIEVPLA